MKNTNAYISSSEAAQYAQFLESENGKIFQETVGRAVSERIPESPKTKILDVACGGGWLAGLLAEHYDHVEAFDAAPDLIEYAKSHYPKAHFNIAELFGESPYTPQSFDVIILSMVIHDVRDQKLLYEKLLQYLKPGGLILITIVNPYYGYPIGVWKRGIIGRLLNKKPQLKLREYHTHARGNRGYTWNKILGSYFFTLEEHMQNALSAGLRLSYYHDIMSPKDSNTFNLKHQLYRFPILLLLEFQKSL